MARPESAPYWGRSDLTALKPRGRDSFGVLLFLSIDMSNGTVYGSDVTVEDYLLEVD